MRYVLLIFILLCSFLPAQAAAKIAFINAGGFYIVADRAPKNTVIGEVKAVGATSYRLVSGSGIAVHKTTGRLTVVTPPKAEQGVQRTMTIAATNGSTTVTASFQLVVLPAAMTQLRGVTRDRWDGMGGENVSDITSFSKPTTTIVNQIEANNLGDNYGLRYRGYLRPKVSGPYTFWLAADDTAQFRLSMTAKRDQLGEAPLAAVHRWGGAKVWNNEPSQKSRTVQLVSGQVYYFELLFKEGRGGDHVALAWQGPHDAAPMNGDSRALIPQLQLMPASAIDVTPPLAPQQATIAQIDKNGVTLQWNAAQDESGIKHYIIARDGVKWRVVTTTEVVDPIQSGVHTYTITAVDRVGYSSPPATIANVAVAAYSAVEQAVATGDAAYVTDAQRLVTAALVEVNRRQQQERQEVAKWYNNDFTLTYTPETTAHYVRPSVAAEDRVYPLIQATTCADAACSEPLAVAGTTASGTRFAAYGHSPLATPVLTNRVVSWLATGDANSKVTSQRIGILNEPTTANALKNWLVAGGMATKDNVALCTVATAASCFDNKTLLFVGSRFDDKDAPAIQRAVASANQRGVAILYNNDNPYYENETVRLLGRELGFTYGGMTYWQKPKVAMTGEFVDRYVGLKRLFDHLQANDWNVNFANCSETNCKDNPTAAAYLTTEFYSGARDYLRATLTKADEEGYPLFTTAAAQHRLLKLAVLLGDVYRRAIVYPVSATKVSNREFFTASYADYTAYYARTINAGQRDLGSFSKALKPNLPRFTKELTFETRRGDYFRAATVYALPGQTVTIERLDGGTNDVKVAINSLRDGSTHEMDDYTRPKFLMTPWVTVTKGKKTMLTSAYGGPIQLRIGKANPATNVTVKVSNVGQHPVWNGTTTTADFIAGLKKGDYDWAEFLTTGFEIHGRRTLMLKSFEDAAFNTPEKLATAIYNDYYRTNYSFAGLLGPDVTDRASIVKACQQLQWNCTDEAIYSMPSMNHFNSDQSVCGYGCSGNPYDAWWAFSPIGWGDSHELGHNLQLLTITNEQGKEVTREVSNNIFPGYVIYAWNKNHPSDLRLHGHRPNLPLYYKTLTAAQRTNNPQATMQQALWSVVPDDNGFKMAFYTQLVQQAKNASFGEGGWDVLTLLHKGYRLKNYADDNEKTWAEWAPRLGLNGYTMKEARDIAPNDLFLILLSKVTQMDEREFFKMWGVTFSDKAAQQVASFRLKPADKLFYYFPVTKDGVYIWGIDSIGSLPVDGKDRTIPQVVKDGFK